MAAGAALPQHRDVRPPAHAGLRRPRAGARRLAARPDELGALVRRDRPLPRALRRSSSACPPSAWRPARASRTSSGSLASGIPDGATRARAGDRLQSLTWPFLVQGSGSRSGRRRSTSSPTRSTPRPTSSPSAPCSPPTARSPISTPSPRRRPRTGRSRSSTRRRRPAGCPFDGSRFDAVACAAYKWLMSPRGTAFLALSRARPRADAAARRQLVRRRRPLRQLLPPRPAARRGRAGGSTSHRRGSPGSATEPALRVLCEIGVDAIHDHDVGAREPLPSRPRPRRRQLGDRVRRICRAPRSGCGRAGILAAVRGGALRASFHVYNTEDDVDAALSALLD